MKQGSVCAALLVAALSGACAARLPVVTDPAYPEYLFPPVPPQYSQSAVARGHQEAWTYLQAGDFVSAQTRYTELLESTPDFFPAAAGLGWLSIARDEHAAAADYFLRATGADPTYVSALVGYGEAMLALGRAEDALGSFEAALEVDPGLVNIGRTVDELRFTVVSETLSAARTAVERGRLPEAVDAYRRVIEASPDSGFLHVELGRVEQQRGDLVAALEQAREAARLDPEDAEAFLLEGEVHEATGDLASALAAFERADSVDPTDDTSRHIDRVRDLILAAGLPPEVTEIAAKDSVTRGDLAVLIGVRFGELLTAAAGPPVIITDTRDHWGNRWIQAVADAGVMEVDAAYRFDPLGPVRRGDLADVVVETLDLVETQRQVSTRPGGARSLTFADMNATHLSYEAAQRAVAAGVLDVLDNNTFQPSRVVAGAEAIEAVDRLAQHVLDER